MGGRRFLRIVYLGQTFIFDVHPCNILIIFLGLTGQRGALHLFLLNNGLRTVRKILYASICIF